MNKPSRRKAAEAFTLVELLVVIAVIFILAWILLPPMLYDGSPRPLTAMCRSHLKQVGMGLIIFADDHNGKFPPQLSITNGGSLELIASNSPALHFRPLSNSLPRNPGIWLCPADQSKQPLTNSLLTDRNLSYFISVDASLALTNFIHAGDRNLQASGQPVKPGLLTLTTNTTVGWTGEMHGKGTRRYGGSILFNDGHVQVFWTNLSATIQRQGLAANRLAVP